MKKLYFIVGYYYRYLFTANTSIILQDIKKISTVEHLERFLLEHGEQVVDILGSEVDRIEQEIKVQPNNMGVML